MTRSVKGAGSVDLALEIVTALSLCDPDRVADDAVADIEGLGIFFDADGRMNGGDELFDTGCLGECTDHRGARPLTVIMPAMTAMLTLK